MDIFHIILTFNLGDYPSYDTLNHLKFHVELEEILVQSIVRLCIIYEEDNIFHLKEKI